MCCLEILDVVFVGLKYFSENLAKENPTELTLANSASSLSKFFCKSAMSASMRFRIRSVLPSAVF